MAVQQITPHAVRSCGGGNAGKQDLRCQGPFMRYGQAREAGEVLGLTRAEEGVVVQEPRRAPSTETALEGAGLTLRTVGWGCPKQNTPSPYLSASDS